MRKIKFFRCTLPLAIFFCAANSLRADFTLGDPPLAPKDVSGLPGGGPHPQTATGGFNVDTTSREQTREFYNAVYTSSTGTPINSTAVTSNCIPGTNSTAFAQATLRRINWFRAMAGIPSSVTFDAGESAENQAAALMMSANNQLQHLNIPTSWSCYTSSGADAAANSNLELGNDGPDAINAFVQDAGASNYEVGHRRWIIYPQTQVMGAGDVPVEGNYNSANATWVFDANYGGPRPATRTPYVPWPPAGFAPYQVVFPQWSFALSNADLSAATVTMTSNSFNVPVTIQPQTNGYGENTLVWYPSALDPTSPSTTFPFGGTDTVYAITISNVVTTAGPQSFSYNVTLFDPGTTGADYFPLVISGPSQPVANTGNAYTCTPATNPNTTSYQWLTAQTTNGNLTDTAQNGTTNFTISPAATYPLITNPPVGSGKCFHLTHNVPVPQLFQLNESLFPSNTTTVSFKSLLGYATTAEIARVQISVDGGITWQDIYTQTGTGGSGDSSFTLHTLSLSAYAGKNTLLRFNYDLSQIYTFTGADPYVGWCLENIVVTNTQQLVNISTNATSSTNFTFTPVQTGNYILQSRGLIFTDFPLDYGTVKQVTAIAGPTVITLKAPAITNGQVKINFAVSSAAATTFHLLQADQLGGAWTTNGTAALVTNILGSSYQFTTTNGPATRFYRVQTP
jgi:hypothetical protein